MRFVAVKAPEQQSVMMLHRVRLMLSRQRTQLTNSIRAHLSEFGVVAPVGRTGVDRLLAIVDDDEDRRIPPEARACLRMLAAQLAVVKQQILENDRLVRASARSTEVGRRLMETPGVGPLLASAFVATLSPTRAPSGPGATWRHGSGLCRSRTPAAAGWHIAGGKQLSQADAGRRRHGGREDGSTAWHDQALACATAGQASDEGRSGRSREQDRADGLGIDDERRALPRTGGHSSSDCISVSRRHRRRLMRLGRAEGS